MIDEHCAESQRSASPRSTTRATENGWLIELYKDGEKTTAYLTAASPGAFKGYHLHRVRAARYVCVRGRMRIILYSRSLNADGETRWKREEHMLDAAMPERLFIPKDVATGLENIGRRGGLADQLSRTSIRSGLEGRAGRIHAGRT